MTPVLSCVFPLGYTIEISFLLFKDFSVESSLLKYSFKLIVEVYLLFIAMNVAFVHLVN